MSTGNRQYTIVKTKLRAALVRVKGETWVDQLLELLSTGYTACERRQGCIGGLWNRFHTGPYFNGRPPKMPNVFRRTFEMHHTLRQGKCIACNRFKMIDEHALGLQCHYTMECAAYLLHSLQHEHPDFVEHAVYIFTALHTYKANTVEFFANHSRTTSSGDTAHHRLLPSFDTSQASTFWQEDEADDESEEAEDEAEEDEAEDDDESEDDEAEEDDESEDDEEAEEDESEEDESEDEAEDENESEDDDAEANANANANADALLQLGLRSVNVVGDGACQFRALALLLWNNEDRHPKVRRLVVRELEENWLRRYDGFSTKSQTDFIKEMKTSTEWGDDITRTAAANAFGRPVEVTTIDKDTYVTTVSTYVPAPGIPRQGADTLQLAHVNGNHYHAVYSANDTLDDEFIDDEEVNSSEEEAHNSEKDGSSSRSEEEDIITITNRRTGKKNKYVIESDDDEDAPPAEPFAKRFCRRRVGRRNK